MPLASLGEANLATSPDPMRAWTLGQLNSGLREKGGSATEKSSNYGNEGTAPALAGTLTSSKGLQCPEEAFTLCLPSIQGTGVWKQWDT